MVRYNPLPWALLAIFVVAGSIACSADGGSTSEDQASEQHEDAELALQMAHLQRWTHKTTLALQERNPELADFYLHEMEETIEGIQEEVPTYEGHPIADLTEEMLVPSVESVDEALDEEDWSRVDKRVQDLVQSCNQCHTATEHGFIQIEVQEANPYPQNFSPSAP